MTKKDYVLIAGAINEIINSQVGAYTTSETQTQMDIIEPFAERLEKENPRFDRTKFVNACFGWKK